MHNMKENMIENELHHITGPCLSWHSSSFSRNLSFSFQTHTGFENSTRPYLRVPQAAGQVKILIFLVKINFFPYNYTNNFCDAGQVPILRYIMAAMLFAGPWFKLTQAPYRTSIVFRENRCPPTTNAQKELYSICTMRKRHSTQTVNYRLMQVKSIAECSKHSAILLTLIRLPFVIKIVVLSFLSGCFLQVLL